MTEQDVDILIGDLGRRGDGVGMLDGKPIYVPRALPGERVRVRILGDQGEGMIARLLTVLESSDQRRTAPCPHYADCGGCSLQHWDEGAYREWKLSRPLEMLERAGVLVHSVRDPIVIPHATRRRATLAAVRQGDHLRLGFHRARSHDITDIPDCLVLTPALNQLMTALRHHIAPVLAESRPCDVFIQDTGRVVDLLLTGPVGAGRKPDGPARAAMAALAESCKVARVSWRSEEHDEPLVIVDRKPVARKMGGLIVTLPPGAFMQPSAEGEAALVDAVLEPVKSAGANRIADLFAGCGTFTGPLLAFGRVQAVEGDKAAVQALQSARGDTAQLSVTRRDLFASPLGEEELNGFDAVVLDPPRAGAFAQAERLARSHVKLVVYVSCNPANFARDAKILTVGGYKLQSLQVIDQFAWSAHQELVAVFTRR